ncbi:hypothetical protein Bca52824_025959 [Brassica carinata]|uniref:Uncharacterized protein n=1 Tax=Brassica carinata TaxID=52824 RepID=A0A8X7V9Q7_BRACI|nr:hypothetical protein Bca52824_025959 [Brassica carinata]
MGLGNKVIGLTEIVSPMGQAQANESSNPFTSAVWDGNIDVRRPTAAEREVAGELRRRGELPPKRIPIGARA